jgi:hypothetical protein
METVRAKKKPAGRPTKTVKKEIRTAIRWSKTEHFIIRQKAAKAGLKVSAYLRQIAIEGKVTTRLNEEERQFVRQLIPMSNNLNQLTKNSH